MEMGFQQPTRLQKAEPIYQSVLSFGQLEPGRAIRSVRSVRAGERRGRWS